MSTTIIPSADRAYWPGPDIISRQSFPATGSTRMTDYAFGLLLIHNDDIVEPGEGFDMHQHQDAEIVTWVVEGRLRHRDSSGAVVELKAGQAEAITAGSGVRHAETNAEGMTSRNDLRVIQMWLPTDEEALTPSHAVADFNEQLAQGGRLVTVVAGDSNEDAPLRIHTAGARLRAARLSSGDSVTTDDATYLHIYVVSGKASLIGAHDPDGAPIAELQEGDAARLEHEGAIRITALEHNGGADSDPSGTEILVWEMERSVRTEPTYR